ELYAIGSPASEKLAFSLTRGIISGVRDFDGIPFLQTDASINRGNSGGPMVDHHGRVLALTSWKITGEALQGLAFGVPIEDALRALGLTFGEQTDTALKNAPGLDPSLGKANVVALDEGADPVPSLDPEGDRARLAAQQDAEAKARKREEARERA